MDHDKVGRFWETQCIRTVIQKCRLQKKQISLQFTQLLVTQPPILNGIKMTMR